MTFYSGEPPLACRFWVAPFCCLKIVSSEKLLKSVYDSVHIFFYPWALTKEYKVKPIMEGPPLLTTYTQTAITQSTVRRV